MPERVVGRVTHYFDRISVAGVALTEPLRVGDRIHIRGHTTDVTMTVDRMQIEHQDVQEAKPGDDVAVHVAAKVRAHDNVLKVED
jgi:putative protease